MLKNCNPVFFLVMVRLTKFVETNYHKTKAMSKTTTLKRVALGIAALLMALTSTTNLLSMGVKDGEAIVVNPVNTDVSGIPRGPVFNPFTAYRLNNTVVLESDTSYGVVNVILVSTAGDYYTTVFDTEDGSVLIPISGDSGDYSLLITDLSGAQFIGTFAI